ncbi:MAG: NADH-quinone oxidoreductase subunit M [Chloroherpetonaceae bacterium]|nr:NADH-quinone oxidoreductase subunit M [Chloroherpetonaceae bacterium]
MLSLITFVPLIAAAIILLIPSKQKEFIRILSLIASGIQIVLAVIIWKMFDPSLTGINDATKFQLVEKWHWISLEFGNYGFYADYFLGVDGLSVTMVILSAVVSFIAVISSWTIEKSVKGYFILFNVLNTAMMGSFVALDFFLFYVFWELMLVPMYFLIGIWGGVNREYASIKFFIYTFFGSVFMLLAGIGLYMSVIDPETGKNTFNMVVMTNPANFLPDSIFAGVNTTWRLIGFFALFIGFAIKIPMFPFHTWLPDAHVEAPTPISVILAGVLLKLGGYGLLRVNFPIFPDIFQNWTWWIAAFGAINIVYGAFCAIAQKDLKKMIAYSSVSHMGYVLLGIAAVNAEGMSGAVMQMFSHGIITSMLFLLVGVIYDRAHTREIEKFGGLASYMPKYTGFVMIAFFASLGLPGLSGFVAEAFVFLGSFSAENTRLLATISTLGILLSAAYLLWAMKRIFFGTRKEGAAYDVTDDGHGHGHAHFHDWKGPIDLDTRELVMLAPLCLFVILLGVYPSLILDLMMPGLNQLVQVLSVTQSVAGF